MTLKDITRHIPNTITCLNLVSGCIAIIMSFSAYDTFQFLGRAWTGWQLACLWIGMAAVFDFCDGASARALKAYSKIGAELDSLSDVVSFGVAPSMLLINVMNHFNNGNPIGYLALAIAVCGALRLARFNVYDTGTTTFRGLPIPAGAIFVIGLVGWVNDYRYPGTIVLVLLAILTGLAMVGRFSMFSLKFKNFAVHQNLRRYVLIAAAAVFVFIYGLSGLAWTVLFYVLMSLMSPRRND